MKDIIEKETVIGKYLPFKREDLSANSDKKISKFRVNAKNLFLTYSQINLTKQSILDQLKLILKDKIKEYIIAQETHKDNRFYLHVFLELISKINITNPSKLALIDSNNQIVYGNYQPVRNRKNTILYITKCDSSYLTSLNLNYSSLEKAKDELFYQQIALITKDFGYEKALDFFCENRPELIAKNYNSIKKNLISYYKDLTEKLKPKYLTSFYQIRSNLSN